jgi:hypothetical protein
MATVRTTALQTKSTQRERHIIADDQKVTLFDIFLIQPVADSIAAQIHIRERLHQNDLLPCDRALSDHGFAKPDRSADRKAVDQFIDHTESDVMSGSVILASGVSKSCDYIISVHPALSCSTFLVFVSALNLFYEFMVCVSALCFDH